MTNSLIIVFLLTMIIHTAETLSYSVRFAGVKLNKIAIALSLTGIIVLVSRTANMIQAPLTAKFVDYAKVDQGFPLLNYLRIILLASSLGTLIAIALFPTFVGLFERVISKLEVEGSIPKLLTSVTIGQLKNSRKYIRKPKMRLYNIRYLGIPKRFLIMNIFVTAFYTVGVLSSLYAAHLVPHLSTTASQASGMINGIATILLTIFIDPQLGIITHKATENVEYRDQLGKIYMLLMGSRFLGTLLGQVVFVPAAHLIIVLVKLI
ncbi:lipid II flippase Amj family protein [Paenibacillus sp. 19GGS1-52]|uniref:lipid II flippase Amj family protein n=1 Tax=Paenibacillus sp. 19GGS1-52 TaxID=2758563 RepID=UPI001EFA746F|nr:lipid II flippase Amj family protein [Paenibacillus sp. 19GGS1-52]ULO10475.1 lipid II flippase Amj family protein [Paenibacillus sp. 19GGS1-52]